jgi:hypothetical protein
MKRLKIYEFLVQMQVEQIIDLDPDIDKVILVIKFYIYKFCM